MPEPKRPLKVFLCHAHADQDAVRKLYTRLTNDGVDAWLDDEKLLPGQNRELEIRKAVREADVVVVCLSMQFNQAGFQQKEVRVALDAAMEQLEGEIFIIPAKLEECDIPESLQRYHWVDLFSDGGYEKLIKALKLRGEQLEKARVQKEEAVKRRLPYFETPMPQNRVMQQNGEYNNADKKPEVENALKRVKSSRQMKTEYIVAIIGAVATLVAGFLSSPLIEKWVSPVPIETELSTVISTLTDQPVVSLQTLESISASETPTIAITSASNSPTPPSLPTEIADSKGVPMALVPEGKFTMGSTDSFVNEKPVLLVYLNSYYIDKYEVTNRNYNLCVQTGECLPPKKRGSKTQTSYFGNPQFDNYPVIYVTWDMAKKYCQWRNARLPSEAEWEKAARGAAGRIYPWGDTIKNTEANYNGLVGDLAVVGKYNSGVSPYGLFDMAGNAQEWVNDWYQANYYSSLFGDVKNPQGPLTGDERVIRGGSWDAGKNFIRTTYRFKSSPSVSFYNISFRCVKDVTP